MNVAIIPARGGSRRIPGKNIKPFHGKPIIAYSIETALMSGLFDDVAVTTDSQEIAAVASQYGATHITRGEHYAEDEVGTQEVMRHALRLYEATYNKHPEIACCIYPCAPMMTVDDLDQGLKALKRDHHTYAFAVAEEPFGPAGTFYWGWTRSFKEHLNLVTPYAAMIPIPPERCIDINTQEDWDKAERMYATWKGLK